MLLYIKYSLTAHVTLEVRSIEWLAWSEYNVPSEGADVTEAR